MALVITNPDTEKALYDLAEATGMSIDDAVAKAAADAQARESWSTGGEVDMERVNALLKEIDALPRLDTRSPDEILGYDKYGLPT